ncbi:hypothetical protein PCAR4_400028 [Paraburkholderia caribensis]|nr:hypothetical protein PCAR4_400028 [Paraburkholderia caribensis]
MHPSEQTDDGLTRDAPCAAGLDGPVRARPIAGLVRRQRCRTPGTIRRHPPTPIRC